jgi:hypothetical protein
MRICIKYGTKILITLHYLKHNTLASHNARPHIKVTCIRTAHAHVQSAPYSKIERLQINFYIFTSVRIVQIFSYESPNGDAIRLIFKVLFSASTKPSNECVTCNVRQAILTNYEIRNQFQ